jgi:hypothetical protein
MLLVSNALRRALSIYRQFGDKYTFGRLPPREGATESYISAEGKVLVEISGGNRRANGG